MTSYLQGLLLLQDPQHFIQGLQSTQFPWIATRRYGESLDDGETMSRGGCCSLFRARLSSSENMNKINDNDNVVTKRNIALMKTILTTNEIDEQYVCKCHLMPLYFKKVRFYDIDIYI